MTGQLEHDDADTREGKVGAVGTKPDGFWDDIGDGHQESTGPGIPEPKRHVVAPGGDPLTIWTPVEAVTWLEWPWRVSSSRPAPMSQTLAERSSDAEARRLPSGLKARSRSWAVWRPTVRGPARAADVDDLHGEIRTGERHAVSVWTDGDRPIEDPDGRWTEVAANSTCHCVVEHQPSVTPGNGQDVTSAVERQAAAGCSREAPRTRARPDWPRRVTRRSPVVAAR